MEDFILQIDKFIRSLVENPYFGFIGFIIGVVSLAYAYYIAKRDRKVKNLYYSLVSNNIIAGSKKTFPKLDVIYDGQKLDNFTVTKVRIKNIGTEVIKLSDIAPNDPIKIIIKPEKAELLDYDILRVSDPNNNFRLNKIDASTLGVEFDFIEAGDTLTAQILHTGMDSRAILLAGTVIGAHTPFASSSSRAFELAASPFERMLRGVYLSSPRKVVLLTSLIVIPFFGILSYLFFTISNFALSILCILPALLLLISSVRVVFRRPDPIRDELSKDWLKSIIGKAVPQIDQDEKLEN